ncbi:TPA: hypothetical protein ACH3X2_010896 [Trebouxia sp. C0005]
MREQSSRAGRGAFGQVDQSRVLQQSTAQQSADAARRASQTETKRQQRANLARPSALSVRYRPTGLLTEMPGLQLELALLVVWPKALF